MVPRSAKIWSSSLNEEKTMNSSGKTATTEAITSPA